MGPEGVLAAAERPAGEAEPASLRPLQEQFPWACRPIPCWPGEVPSRVVAYKAFLRTDQDGSRVISASQARTYFGHRAPVEGETASYGPGNLYGLTPYSRHSWKYKQDWAVSPAVVTARVDRFRWHAGAAAGVRERLRAEAALGDLSRLQLAHCRVLKRLLTSLRRAGQGEGGEAEAAAPRLELPRLQCVWGAATEQPAAKR